jgi:hypothetical protein
MPQGPDLSANLLGLHPLLAGEPHPDAHTAGIQRGIAQRFIRALCRAVPVRGGGGPSSGFCPCSVRCCALSPCGALLPWHHDCLPLTALL